MPAIQARVAMMPGRSNRPMKSLHTRGSVMGSGIGSVLLDGGNGLASSYRGIEDYVKTTGNPIKGAGLSDKSAIISRRFKKILVFFNYLNK